MNGLIKHEWYEYTFYESGKIKTKKKIETF